MKAKISLNGKLLYTIGGVTGIGMDSNHPGVTILYKGKINTREYVMFAIIPKGHTVVCIPDKPKEPTLEEVKVYTNDDIQKLIDNMKADERAMEQKKLIEDHHWHLLYGLGKAIDKHYSGLKFKPDPAKVENIIDPNVTKQLKEVVKQLTELAKISLWVSKKVPGFKSGAVENKPLSTIVYIVSSTKGDFHGVFGTKNEAIKFIDGKPNFEVTEHKVYG